MCSRNRRRCTPTATSTATPSRSGRSSAPRGVDVSSPWTSPPGPRSTESLDPQQGPVCGLAVTPDATRLIELTSCLDRPAAFAEWRLDGGGPVSRLVVDAPTPEPSYTVGFGYGGDDSALVVEFATPPDEQPVTHVIDAASGRRPRAVPRRLRALPDRRPRRGDRHLRRRRHSRAIRPRSTRACRSDHRSWLRDPGRVDERQPGSSSKVPATTAASICEVSTSTAERQSGRSSMPTTAGTSSTW